MPRGQDTKPLKNINRLSSKPKYMKACKKGDLESIKKIVSSDIRIDLKAMETAVASGNIEIVKFLVKKGFNDDEAIFMSSCKNGCLNIVRWLHKDRKFDICSPDGLFAACREGCLELVKYLIANGADPNESSNICYNQYLVTEISNAPFNFAITSTNLDLVKWFVENTSVDHKDVSDFAIFEIVRYDDIDMMIYLLQNGLDIEKIITDIENNDAEEEAAQPIFQWLLDKQVDIYILLELIVKSNTPENLAYLYDQDVMGDEIILSYMFKHGTDEIFDYLAKFDYKHDEDDPEKLLLDKCIQFGTKERMLWIAERYKIDPKSVDKTLTLSIRSSWVEWYRAQCKRKNIKLKSTKSELDMQDKQRKFNADLKARIAATRTIEIQQKNKKTKTPK